jgi:hypothetical protein
MLLPRREKGAEGPVSARLELAAPAYIFNQRTGAYLGHTSSVRLRLHPTSATILSLLPYRNGVAVADGGLVAQGGFAELEIALPTVGGAEPTGHVLRVRLIDPDGKELWLGARTLFPAGANTHVSLPFAFNDRPGTWTALVRDVATRTEARYRIRLEENHE